MIVSGKKLFESFWCVGFVRHWLSMCLHWQSCQVAICTRRRTSAIGRLVGPAGALYKPVAHAADIEDPPFVAGGELAAQAAGVAIERSRGADLGVSPNGPQQLVLGEDPLGLAGEVDEQLVLHAA